MKNRILLLFASIIALFLIANCRESVNDPISEKIVDEESFVVNLKEIKYPAEKVKWEQGESYEIKWAITDNLDKVKIILLKKYKQVAVISEITDNDGGFNWSIPSDLPGSHHYRIRLVSPYNLAASSTSVEFEIQRDSEGPVIFK